MKGVEAQDFFFQKPDMEAKQRERDGRGSSGRGEGNDDDRMKSTKKTSLTRMSTLKILFNRNL